MPNCLVVEDSEDVRRIMCRLLNELGYETLEADGPESASEIVGSGQPSVIFLDWDLPDLGALEFFRRLDSYDNRPLIVLCITHNDPKEMAMAKSAGAAFQLMKPYDKPALLSVLKKVEKVLAANGVVPIRYGDDDGPSRQKAARKIA